MEEYNKNEEKSMVPENYVPLRDTLTKAGESVGYNEKSGNPIVNGLELDKNNGKLFLQDGRFWADPDYAESLKTKGYTSKYDNKKDTLISRLMQSSFSYNPETDRSLQVAQNLAMKSAAQSANARGMYGGTTSQIMQQRAAQELIPQYENLAYQKYLGERERDKETLSAISEAENNELNALKLKNDIQKSNAEQTLRREQAAQDRVEYDINTELKRQQMEQAKYNDDYNNALKKFKIYGTIDEQNTDILGLAYNQPTWEVMEFLDLKFNEKR